MSEAKRAFKEGLGTDTVLVARFVDLWRRGDPNTPDSAQTPIKLNDVAWELGADVGKVAITMKYAVRRGWVQRMGPRTDQAAWQPTREGLDAFPADGAHVMPDAVDER